MSKRRTSGNTRRSEVPYKANDRAEVLSFWKEATAHRGVAATELGIDRLEVHHIFGPYYQWFHD